MNSSTPSAPSSDELDDKSQIHQDMNLATIECHLTDDLPTTKWKKLMWNIPFNGLSVILNASTDAIMKNPDSRLLARRISEEVRSIACQTGSQIDPSYVDWVIDHTDDMVPYERVLPPQSLRPSTNNSNSSQHIEAKFTTIEIHRLGTT